MKEKCYNHPERKALSFCRSCGRFFCSDCLTEGVEYGTGYYYCHSEQCQGVFKRTERISEPFSMEVEDVFAITGRGPLVTGRVRQGMVKTGDKVEVVGSEERYGAEVVGIEKSRKLMEVAKVGDEIGILLGGLKKNQVRKGMLLQSHKVK